MYAIIKAGGRQIRVEEGQEVDVDYQDIAKGEKVTFDKVLAVSGDDGVKIGKPEVAGASVTCEVVGVRMGPKLVVQKFRRRKNSRRKTGHRQMFTTLRVDSISA